MKIHGTLLEFSLLIASPTLQRSEATEQLGTPPKAAFRSLVKRRHQKRMQKPSQRTGQPGQATYIGVGTCELGCHQLGPPEKNLDVWVWDELEKKASFSGRSMFTKWISGTPVFYIQFIEPLVVYSVCTIWMPPSKCGCQYTLNWTWLLYTWARSELNACFQYSKYKAMNNTCIPAIDETRILHGFEVSNARPLTAAHEICLLAWRGKRLQLE